MKSVKLTEKQINQSLSSRRKGSKPSLKSVLSQPFPRYWPEITKAETEELVEEFKKINNAEKSNCGTKITKKQNYIIYGLNASLRHLQKDDIVDVLLISANIKPKHIIDQIILLGLANNKKIKILCIPDMDSAFRELVKFSCLCITLTNIHLNSPYQSAAYPIIDRFCSRFDIPKVILKNIEGSRKYYSDNCIEMEENHVEKHSKEIENDVDFNKLYLRKVTTNERAFIPNNTKKDVQSFDFISIDSFNDSKKSTKFNNLTKNVQENQNILLNVKEKTVDVKKLAVKKPIETACVKLQNLVIPKPMIEKKKKKKKIKNKQKMVQEVLRQKNDKSGQKLFNYISLGVNKIQGNPNKIKKAKKNKKKKN